MCVCVHQTVFSTLLSISLPGQTPVKSQQIDRQNDFGCFLYYTECPWCTTSHFILFISSVSFSVCLSLTHAHTFGCLFSSCVRNDPWVHSAKYNQDAILTARAGVCVCVCVHEQLFTGGSLIFSLHGAASPSVGRATVDTETNTQPRAPLFTLLRGRVSHGQLRSNSHTQTVM